MNNVKRLNIDSPMLLGATSSSHDPRSVSWSPPLDNFFKINVDGSSFGNLGSNGYSGLIWSREGAWLIGFSGSCGTTTNLNPELQVIAKGLQLALNEWYRAVVCESDSKTTLMLIDEGVHDTHPYAPIVSDIKSLSLSLSLS